MIDPETGIELMRHQREGIRFLRERRSGLIAFEQGLGKTLLVIAAFREVRAATALEAMVVICPNSLKRNWLAEIEQFAPELTTLVIEGPARVRRQATAEATADVVIINYEAARSDITAIRAFLQRRRAALVLDESHFIKNARSLTTVAAQHFAPLSEYRWLLTGTPVTNSAADLHPQINVVAGGDPLGPLDTFMVRFGEADRVARQRDELAERIMPYVLRRTKEECLDLPEKTFVDILVELPSWQRAIYNAVRDGLIEEIKGMSAAQFARFAPTAMTRLLRLSQVASNPGLVLPEEKRIGGKLIELDHVVDEIVHGTRQKLIIWSYYVKTIEMLVDRYGHFGAVALYGQTPARERQDVARRFQSDAGTNILVANPAAAGTGLTLTAAHFAVYESLTWRYDLYAQSQDRNHRIGQSLPVTYIRVVAADTIEQVIVEALARKERFAKTILGDEPPDLAFAEMGASEFCTMLVENRLPVRDGPELGEAGRPRHRPS